MKIALYHPACRAADADPIEVYVRRLTTALAVDHQATLVTTPSALHHLMDRERPEILHLHQTAGLALARLLGSARAGQFDRVPVALTLHDYRLCCVATDLRHPDGHGCPPRLVCRMVASLNRSVTGSVGLVHSPSQHVLEQHLQRGFFQRAAQVVLPYGSAPPWPASANATNASEPVVIRSASPGTAQLAIQDAFQIGALVIATRQGGIPEIVRDGVNGLLVEPGDEPAIAEAIERLRRSPELAIRLRAEAGKTARLYDMAFHAAHLAEAYTRVIAANRVGPFFRKAA
ncbi:MAG: glycosyltransferase [Candidatus Dormibacter sp.]